MYRGQGHPGAHRVYGARGKQLHQPLQRPKVVPSNTNIPEALLCLLRFLSVKVERASPGLALGLDLEECGDGVGHQLLQGVAELHVMHLGQRALGRRSLGRKVTWTEGCLDGRSLGRMEGWVELIVDMPLVGWPPV